MFGWMCVWCCMLSSKILFVTKQLQSFHPTKHEVVISKSLLSKDPDKHLYSIQYPQSRANLKTYSTTSEKNRKIKDNISLLDKKRQGRTLNYCSSISFDLPDPFKTEFTPGAMSFSFALNWKGQTKLHYWLVV